MNSKHEEEDYYKPVRVGKFWSYNDCMFLSWHVHVSEWI